MKGRKKSPDRPPAKRLSGTSKERGKPLAIAGTAVSDELRAIQEIVRVMRLSPTDASPVFDAIVTSARNLLGGSSANLMLVRDGHLHLGALTSTSLEGDEALRRILPIDVRDGRSSLVAQVVHESIPLTVGDVQNDPRVTARTKDAARIRGFRSIVWVPLVRAGESLGVIGVTREALGGFSQNEIALLQTFADHAVIAIENVRLFTELESKNRALTSSLDQQTATGEILRIIASSPTDVQPVFETILDSALRLCDALYGGIFLVRDTVVDMVAHGNIPDDALEVFRRVYPRPLSDMPERSVGFAAIHRGEVTQLADVFAQGIPTQQELARATGFRALLTVPLRRDGRSIGYIIVTRATPGAFPRAQIDLLTTFADQAVIAIENVRLFTELRANNEALTRAHAQVTEALEQQTATADILKVIAGSPTNLQPVLDALVQSAGRLCKAADTFLLLVEHGELRVVAAHGSTEDAVGLQNPVHRGWAAGRAVVDRCTVHVDDLVQADAEFPLGAQIAIRLGHRTALAIPLLREGLPIGALFLRRREVRKFSEQEIQLLKTFADQAVIAIENVRLFSELQTSNRELTTALDTQTATADILRVISRSQTDVQPVFDAILGSAVRLLKAYSGALTRIAGDQIALAALTSTDDAGDAALGAAFPQSVHSGGPYAQTIRERMPLNVADTETDSRLPESARAYARARGHRSWVVVPMLRRDGVLGTISVTRREPGGFTDDEIELLRTFADQAVIAIENARLLSELQARTAALTQSVDQLTALGEVGQAVSSSLDVDTVLNTIVGRAVELASADGGTLYEYDEHAETFELRVATNVDDQVRRELQRTSHLRLREGAVGKAGATREPVQIPDIAIDGSYDSRLRSALVRAGTRALLAVPLLREERILGGLVVSRRTPGAFAPEVVSVLQTFATQSALAIQNARLFREIELKSRELEVASRHKSEFLASMSHELRTPLNAIIGFSDVLLQGMFGETNDKQTEYLRDIFASGQHLLSLINDILDLSKIEAGRMELDIEAFDLPTAIDDAMLLMRERASRRGIALERHVDERVGEIRADQRKMKQVLLNLLSNAVKFTPQGGRIDVRAVLTDETAEISVMDTGIGIAPEDHEAVFEEFRQVGSADKKAEGTGLGLALCRKFIELHGGRISLTSELGKGSTFTFALPVGGPPAAAQQRP